MEHAFILLFFKFQFLAMDFLVKKQKKTFNQNQV